MRRQRIQPRRSLIIPFLTCPSSGTRRLIESPPTLRLFQANSDTEILEDCEGCSDGVPGNGYRDRGGNGNDASLWKVEQRRLASSTTFLVWAKGNPPLFCLSKKKSKLTIPQKLRIPRPNIYQIRRGTPRRRPQLDMPTVIPVRTPQPTITFIPHLLLPTPTTTIRTMLPPRGPSRNGHSLARCLPECGIGQEPNVLA